jgi:hypothetical protein
MMSSADDTEPGARVVCGTDVDHLRIASVDRGSGTASPTSEVDGLRPETYATTPTKQAVRMRANPPAL